MILIAKAKSIPDPAAEVVSHVIYLFSNDNNLPDHISVRIRNAMVDNHCPVPLITCIFTYGRQRQIDGLALAAGQSRDFLELFLDEVEKHNSNQKHGAD